MDIKFNIGDEVYLYDTSAVVKTVVKGIDIKPNNITFKIEGYYHNKPEEVLFPSFEDLVEDLRTKIITPRSISKTIKDTAKNFVGK